MDNLTVRLYAALCRTRSPINGVPRRPVEVQIGDLGAVREEPRPEPSIA